MLTTILITSISLALVSSNLIISRLFLMTAFLRLGLMFITCNFPFYGFVLRSVYLGVVLIMFILSTFIINVQASEFKQNKKVKITLYLFIFVVIIWLLFIRFSNKILNIEHINYQSYEVVDVNKVIEKQYVSYPQIKAIGLYLVESNPKILIMLGLVFLIARLIVIFFYKKYLSSSRNK